MRRSLLALVPLALLTAAAMATTNAPAQSSPNCPWMNRSLSSDDRAQMLLAKMTLAQKDQLLYQSQPVWAHYGVAGYIPAQPDLCIPDLVLNDAGQGVGDQEVNTTAFPAPKSQASSWDPALQKRFGAALGWEALHKGVNVQLAPGIEIDRVPINGRNFEYLSEDPFLAGKGAAALVQGIQISHVVATVQHYIANSQEN